VRVGRRPQAGARLRARHERCARSQAPVSFAVALAIVRTSRAVEPHPHPARI